MVISEKCISSNSILNKYCQRDGINQGSLRSHPGPRMPGSYI